MEQRHRNAIRKCWTILVRSLTHDQLTNIVDHLTEQNILTMGMRETIECEQSTTTKTRVLLTILQKRGPLTFQHFVDALLLNDAVYVADILLSNVDLPSLDRPSTSIQVPPEVPRQDRSTIEEPNEEIRRERPSETEVPDPVTCTICMENAISVTFDPCGHTLCPSCGDRISRQNTCCFCHQSITRMIRIYIG